MKTVLVILTNDEFWLSELAAPYYELAGAGFHVDLASLAGGKPAADPSDMRGESEAMRRFLDDRVACARLESTAPLANVSSEYDAYFVVGGVDLDCDVVGTMLGAAAERGKVVATACRGEAARVRLRDGTLVTEPSPQSPAAVAKLVIDAVA
jgi:putative intracellular protease/amidase